MGVESARDVKIDVKLPSGIEMIQSPSLLLGTLNPNENTTLVLSIKAYSTGIYYLEIEPQSANACGEKVIIPIRIGGEDGTGAEDGESKLWIYIAIIGIAVAASVATTIAVMKIRFKKEGRL